MFHPLSFQQIRSLLAAMTATGLVACGGSTEPAESPIDVQEIPASAADGPADPSRPATGASEQFSTSATAGESTPAVGNRTGTTAETAGPTAESPAEPGRGIGMVSVSTPKAEPPKAAGTKTGSGTGHKKAAGGKGACGAGTCG